MLKNMVYGELSPDCQDFLDSRLVCKPIQSGEVLFEANAPIQNIIFPVDGIISMQMTDHDGRTVENYFTGYDGLLGAYSLLGNDRHPCTGKTVISGRACWLPLADLREAEQRFACLRPTIEACLNRIFGQLIQNVLCANCHSATQRIATWLLHANDRVESETYDLTQRTLSEIFGLRAATVSDSCNYMMSIGAVRYSRGQFRIRDRDLLLGQACDCYEQVRLRDRPERG